MSPIFTDFLLYSQELKSKELKCKDHYPLQFNIFFHCFSFSSFVFSKDVRLPSSMQRSMAVEAETTRDARAKVMNITMMMMMMIKA